MRLPDELLGMIFLHYVSLHTNLPDAPLTTTEPALVCSDVFKMLYITHICQRWRALSIGMPRLWTCVPMTPHLECLHAFLERSQTLALSVLPHTSEHADIIRCRSLVALSGSLARVRSLALRISRPLLHSLLELGEETHDPCLPKLEELELIYYGGYDHLSCPTFWFFSKAAMPGLRTLRTYLFSFAFTRGLVRDTLTRLMVTTRDESSEDQWIELLKQVPVLEMLAIEGLSFTGITNPENFNIEPVPSHTLIPMHHLQRFMTYENHCSILSSRLLNRLEVPASCSVFLSVDSVQFDFPLECYSSLFRVLGAKMVGNGSVGGPAQPAAMAVSFFLGQVGLWSSANLDRDLSYMGSPDAKNDDHDYDIDLHASVLPNTDVEWPPVLQKALREGGLPLSSLTSLTIEGFSHMEHETWAWLFGCTHLQTLCILNDHCDESPGNDYSRLLLALAGATPPFPELQFVRLENVAFRPSPPPHDTPPPHTSLTALFDRFLDTRRHAGHPIEELRLVEVRDVQDDDLAWLQARSQGQTTKISWTRFEEDEDEVEVEENEKGDAE
ncbi:hypothetical protein PsYK624_062760 [Phanerochaete sordida]|uniref:F-box domain-containing protein n=1 Tax=Phanerochaete sordida TaxID=48140 RepID=A0A9P3G8G4_9APHY|nr:hypothetical protein PsYK624_062760 [Phanerochaete sordida]